jgi:hypothetical protein
MELPPRSRIVAPGGYGPNAQKPRARPELDLFTWYSTDTKTFEQVQWVGSLGRYAWQAVGDPRDSPSGPTGSLYETVPRDRVTTTLTWATTSGTAVAYATGMPMLYAGQKYSALNIFVGATAGTITHSWGAIIRQSDRVVLATSADVTTAFTTNAVRTFTFGTAYEPENDTPFYAVFGLVWSVAPVFPVATAPNSSTLGAVAPILIGTSTTGLSAPVAVGSTYAALTSAALAIPYIYLT